MFQFVVFLSCFDFSSVCFVFRLQVSRVCHQVVVFLVPDSVRVQFVLPTYEYLYNDSTGGVILQSTP